MANSVYPLEDTKLPIVEVGGNVGVKKGQSVQTHPVPANLSANFRIITYVYEWQTVRTLGTIIQENGELCILPQCLFLILWTFVTVSRYVPHNLSAYFPCPGCWGCFSLSV